MIDDIEWWPLVIGVLWKRNREDRDEKTEREREIFVMRGEKNAIKQEYKFCNCYLYHLIFEMVL